MSTTILEVLLKACAGGLFVLLFAALAEMLTPKRLAGVLSAAPSVALGSLLVTATLSTSADMAMAAGGMRAGALAFTVYCLVAASLMKIWRAWPSALAALGVWLVVAGAGHLLLGP
jgi:hypothetical protein